MRRGREGGATEARPLSCGGGNKCGARWEDGRRNPDGAGRWWTGGGAREGREAGHRRAAASSHLIPSHRAGLRRALADERAEARAARGVTGQVARGSCADSDADAAERRRNGARVRWKQQRARADEGRAALVVEELPARSGWGCV